MDFNNYSTIYNNKYIKESIRAIENWVTEPISAKFQKKYEFSHFYQCPITKKLNLFKLLILPILSISTTTISL